jgi:hypothetical protein
LGLLSFYVGAFGLYKFTSGNPKPAPVKKTSSAKVSKAAAASHAGEFQGPTMENADKWFSDEKNIAAWEKWMSTSGNLESWEKSLK